MIRLRYYLFGNRSFTIFDSACWWLFLLVDRVNSAIRSFYFIRRRILLMRLISIWNLEIVAIITVIAKFILSWRHNFEFWIRHISWRARNHQRSFVICCSCPWTIMGSRSQLVEGFKRMNLSYGIPFELTCLKQLVSLSIYSVTHGTRLVCLAQVIWGPSLLSMLHNILNFIKSECFTAWTKCLDLLSTCSRISLRVERLQYQSIATLMSKWGRVLPRECLKAFSCP